MDYYFVRLDFIGHAINFGYRLDYSKKDIYDGWDTPIINDREIIKDSYIQLSDKPGLKLDLNKDLAMKYLVEGEKWRGVGDNLNRLLLVLNLSCLTMKC